MQESNFDRMIRLAEEVFDVRNDPAQIAVDDAVIARLLCIHPACVMEERDDDGPIAWMLLFPTTGKLMREFLSDRINERELLERTPLQGSCEALYLCSALVLPEYRRHGIALRLLQNAVERIRADHPIGSLFAWTFSPEGAALGHRLAERSGLPIFFKESR
jgi:GNAT superfamily N-acetyltransferase